MGQKLYFLFNKIKKRRNHFICNSYRWGNVARKVSLEQTLSELQAESFSLRNIRALGSVDTQRPRRGFSQLFLKRREVRRNVDSPPRRSSPLRPTSEEQGTPSPKSKKNQTVRRGEVRNIERRSIAHREPPFHIRLSKARFIVFATVFWKRFNLTKNVPPPPRPRVFWGPDSLSRVLYLSR